MSEPPLTPQEEADLRRRLVGAKQPIELWPTTGRRLLATLDAARAVSPSGLDVRLVAKAVENVAKRHGIVKDPPIPLVVARIWGYSAAPAEMDAEIAREYAALVAHTGDAG